MPRNHQIWPEFGISDHCWLIRCPVDGLAGGCGARAVSRKTPIYFIIIIIEEQLTGTVNRFRRFDTISGPTLRKGKVRNNSQVMFTKTKALILAIKVYLP